MNIQKEYNDLIIQLQHYSDLYYNSDSPEITDYEYDMLVRKIKLIEKEHPELIKIDSPTQKVGGKALFNEVKHRNPMLSLNDIFAKEELFSFCENSLTVLGHDPLYIVEPKIDGLSLTLRYEYGKLVMAETRGDGTNTGEDVTINAYQIDDIKKELDTDIPYLEIRGEVYMDKNSFSKLNSEYDEDNKLANSRNAAAGTLRNKDPFTVKKRKLSFFAFNLQEIKGMDICNHLDSYKLMTDLRIKHISKYYICKDKEEIWAAIQTIGHARNNLDYDIDGVVVKINDYADREKLGATTKCPRWATAYKFPPEEATTTVIDIQCQVGRTGKITPVAIFEPIKLAGTTVSRATLHNQEYINKIGINIGSTIKVVKSGDIIPKIVSTDFLPWDEKKEPYKMPDVCPICKSKLYSETSCSDKRCINPNCNARLERSLIHFCSRDAMNIEGIGPETVSDLISFKFVKAIPDLYLLQKKRTELIESKIFGTSYGVDKILNNIEESKSRSLEKLIFGFGIPGVGKALARTLAMKYCDCLALFMTSVSELMTLPNIAEKTANDIYAFVNDIDNIAMIQQLDMLGVNLYFKNEASTNKLAGLKIAVTGRFINYKRDKIISLILSNGGVVTENVTKDISYLLVGDDAAARKIELANELEKPIIDINYLFNLLG